MIKRYDVQGCRDWLIDVEEFDNGDFCYYDDVEKLIEINKEMLDAVNELYYNSAICDGEKIEQLIEKAEQLNEV